MERRAATLQSLIVPEIKSNLETTLADYEMHTDISVRLSELTPQQVHIILRYISSLSPIENAQKDDRDELWNMLFPNKPVPQSKRGAAKKNLGILNREIKEELEDEELEDLLRRSRST